MTVIPLRVVHTDLLEFGSDARPLRPSKLSDFLSCPMQVVLTQNEDGNKVAADTGSLVHAAAHAYHTTKESEAERIAAGQAALLAAREKFPQGDEAKAIEIFRSYSLDQANVYADVVHSELPVRLTLPADPGDPTGKPVVIAGTLDQIRREGGKLLVCDIKTGSFHAAHEAVFAHMIQQAVYVLAARETLGEDFLPGYLIMTAGYARIRGTVRVDNVFTVEQARDLVLTVPLFVAAVRRGDAVFRPGIEACKFCPVKKAGHGWPKCHSYYKGLYG